MEQSSMMPSLVQVNNAFHLCSDYQHSTSPLNPSRRGFFISTPISPQASQNDNLNLPSVPDLSFKVDGNGDGDGSDEEFEFRFPLCESDGPPFSPNLTFFTSAPASSSDSVFFPTLWSLPLPPILKPPPFLLPQVSKPCPVSAWCIEEDSLAFENSASRPKHWNGSACVVVDVNPIKEAVETHKGKPSNAKKWRLKDLLRQTIDKDKPNTLHRRHQQGSMLTASSVLMGKKAISSGTAIGVKASPQYFPLPTPPPILRSSLPTPKRKASAATLSSHEILYTWKRAQQKKSCLPYCLGFLGFASKRYAYAPITDLSRSMQPVK